MAAKNLEKIINGRNFRTAAEKMAFAFGWNAAMEHAEALKPSHNSAMRPCQASDCSGVAVVHLCRNCFDSINSVVRLPRQQ